MKKPTLNRSILNLAIPNIVTNITVPLLGLVDLALMGQLNDPVFIGAIALGSIIFNVIYASFNFLRMGSTGFTAQAVGSKNKTEVSLVLIRSVLVALLISIVVLVLQYPIQYISFKILDGSNDVISLARQYYFIRIWAAPATICLYAFFGWFLGIQNSKIPMIIAITINAINIILNFVFVMGLGMKSDGVALATVIAQYAGLVLSLFYIYTKYRNYIIIFPYKVIIKAEALIKFFKVNSDIFIRTILLLLTLAFFTNASAKQGDTVLAINTLLFQFFFIFSYFADGFAFAGEALTGKAYGSDNKELLKKTIRYLFYWGWGIAMITSVVYLIGIEWFISILTNNSEVITLASRYKYWIIIIPISSMAAFIWDGIYVGVTASKEMRNAMIISSIVVFLPTYYLSVDSLDNNALWLALNTFLVARTLLMWHMWQKIKNTTTK